MNVLDVIGAVFLFSGCTLTLIAAIGIFRYEDLIVKQHVATKPQVVALILNLTGTALLVRDASMTWTMLLVIAFMLITSPISAHMLSRAGYRTGRINYDALVEDDLGEDLQAGEFSDESGSR
ncbi:MAG: monovalent cation/H(+) antiporter subunit G [Ancrocorticia sp.]|jgi:multicomponent Na+:H+ antiporter subunit G|nr:monovalent cation/H(+) antiporter subunit G [Ancrocorticia sp.]MCI1895875.1 monovalent cation/H(+) antiporter subunit G [Ancrocorticia sp.]MCI1932534.1 monovalent cation/H(+) antiporter subunit G [Ancrocorticia sp.]MCI1963714.1 monovalent cation/H(+) antiporter subunit G [Ancrocorticia sp.]MCI2003045.1 monovalent cation/H(+) antiporter subunit G [Ancrocorticia sp.]